MRTGQSVLLIITGSLLMTLLQGFSKNDSKSIDDIKTTITISQADVEKGRILISKSDCIACHKEKLKIIGPTYLDVALKYKPTESNIEYLGSKIIKGGSGVWGQVPMPGHPALSKGDVEEMVKYILSIKP